MSSEHKGALDAHVADAKSLNVTKAFELIEVDTSFSIFKSMYP